MNELIRVSDRQIGDGPRVKSVDARELYTFLDVGRHFSGWIKARINEGDFVRNRDFASFQTAPLNQHTGNRGVRIEYLITLEMAKELAMLERNERGSQARQYFIDCERHMRLAITDIQSALSDPERLRELLLSYTEQVLTLKKKTEQPSSGVDSNASLAQDIHHYSVQETARILGTGRNRLFRFLRHQDLLTRNNVPLQRHIDAGYFKVAVNAYKNYSGAVYPIIRTLITDKGLAYIQSRVRSSPIG